MKQSVIAVLLGIVLVSCAAAQSDWDTYPPRKIVDLIKQEQDSVNGAPRSDIIISAQPFPSKTIATYTGTKRPIDANGLSFIKLWTATRGAAAETTSMLVEEVLVKEKENEYWIPVLKTIVPFLEKELRPGDEIEIYYFYLGGFNAKTLTDKTITDPKKPKPVNNEKDAIRWMFAVEEFQKIESLEFIPRPLDKAIDRGMEAPGKIKEIWWDPRQIRSKTKVVFTGDVRTLLDSRRPLVEMWFAKNGFPPGASSLMAREARFIEGDKEYWIPVRNKTLDEIVKVLKKGDSVVLNTILAGGIRNGDKIEWLFLAGEHSFL